MLRLLLSSPELVPRRELAAGLRLAVRCGHTPVVEMLLRAAPSADDSLLQTAADIGHADVLRVLLRAGCDVNAATSSRATPLHFATRAGHQGCVAVLLDADADVNARDGDGNTPLIAAAKNCHGALTVIKLLVDARCILDNRNQDGRTALHYACSKAIGVELLLTAGASPDIQDNDGNTPLLLAAVEGFDTVIKSLVAHGCDCNIKNNFNKNSLHFLAMKNHFDGIDAIAHAGGDVNMSDNDGNTPLWFAVNYNRPEAVKALLMANSVTCSPVSCANPGVPLKTALAKRLFGIAKLLILAGCELSPLYAWTARQRDGRVERPPRGLPERDDTDGDEELSEELSDALRWFSDWMHTPHSLQQMCRIYIRRYIGLGLLKKGEELPLPVAVRDYVTLKEVEDHHIEGFLI